MRTRLIDFSGKVFRGAAIACLLLAGSIAVTAQNGNANAEQAITFDQDYLSPAVPAKQKKAVVESMRHEAEKMKKLGFDVESDRGGEVVVVTIPAEKLFAANSTDLLPSAAGILNNFLQYLSVPGKYKLLLKMHSDNTGSEDYSFDITDARIVALYDFFDSRTNNQSAVNGYPAGLSEPLVPNDSRANRAKNRRLEIFIVPDLDLIKQVKHKK